MTDTPTPRQTAADGSDPYRQLLAHLQHERARALRNASRGSLDEGRWTAEGIAAGLRIAEAWAITLFEGHQARQAYLAADDTVGPTPAGTVDTVADRGPTVGEAAADDRRWELEKSGE